MHLVIAGVRVMSRRLAGGQDQKHFSPVGSKLYFHVNSSRKKYIVLNPNMAALSSGCKPRILLLLHFQFPADAGVTIVSTETNLDKTDCEPSRWVHFPV